MRSAVDWTDPQDEKQILSSENSPLLLNQAVTHFVGLLTGKLARFNSRLIVEELLQSHEALLRDKWQWLTTARAVLAWYGDAQANQAASTAERERAESSIALRALMEAAICTCPPNDGMESDPHSLDELFGLMAALMALGSDSDTIYYGLAAEGITVYPVYPSGSYSFAPDRLKAIGSTYPMETFREIYEKAAEDYERAVRRERPADVDEIPEMFRSYDFRSAFVAEYQMDFENFREIVATLLDEGVKRETVVLTLRQEELFELTRARGLPKVDIEAFLQSFVLISRPSWVPRDPVKPKDVNPWRFERKFSVMLRPVIQTGPESYTYGLSTLRESIVYVLHSITDGKFDKDVFSSTEMRSYLGSRVDQLGHEFALDVANLLRELGWNAQPEVKMSALGAPKNPNLGDIDVLAWRETGQVLAVECKRMRMARTVAEAHTCARFQGNAGDHLAKHVRRAQWLRQNTAKLAEFVKLPEQSIKLRTPLVTSAPVPFRYLVGLPVPPEDIVPINGLSDFCQYIESL